MSEIFFNGTIGNNKNKVVVKYSWLFFSNVFFFIFFIYVESASKPSNFNSFYKIYILLLGLYFIQDFICTLFVLYLYSICTLFVLCLYFICTLFVLYLYFICTLFVLYLYFVCTLFVLYLYFICTLFVLCLYLMQMQQNLWKQSLWTYYHISIIFFLSSYFSLELALLYSSIYRH